MKLLCIIANHNRNAEALALKARIAPHCDCLIFDSGSANPPSDFDRKFPNIHYAGLLNEACREAQAQAASHLLFITSDVGIDDPARLIARIRDLRPALYGPSLRERDGNHRQMIRRAAGGVRAASFVDGFCFAVETRLLARLCPVDLAQNHIGHGLDIYLGFLALGLGRPALVDDDISVTHPQGSGYDDAAARRQRQDWISRQSPAARRFHRLASMTFFKRPLGQWLLLNAPLRNWVGGHSAP